MDSKGFYAEAIPIIFSFFLFVLIFVIFFSWFFLFRQENQATIASAATHSFLQYEFLALMQTPLQVDNETLTFLEALAVAAESQEKSIKVRDELFPLLAKLRPLSASPLCVYFMELRDDNSEEIFALRSISFVTMTYKKEEHVLSFPSYHYPLRFYRLNWGIECSRY